MDSGGRSIPKRPTLRESIIGSFREGSKEMDIKGTLGNKGKPWVILESTGES